MRLWLWVLSLILKVEKKLSKNKVVHKWEDTVKTSMDMADSQFSDDIVE